MHNSIVKKKLKNNEPVLAVKSNYNHPQIIEMIGMLGYDCLWVCNEHGYMDESELATTILAARAQEMDVMLRRNMSGYEEFLRPLEMGVHGFMVPRIRSVNYIKEVVDFVKFPPEGRRGIDGVNVDADFGLLGLQEYIKRANEETFIVAQIEDKEAIPLIDDIAAVDGVDVLFVGPADLSLSLGMPGQFRDPAIIEIIDAVAEACKKQGKIAGTPPMGQDDVDRLLEKGFRFFTSSADYRFIKKGLLDMKETYKSAGFSFR